MKSLCNAHATASSRSFGDRNRRLGCEAVVHTCFFQRAAAATHTHTLALKEVLGLSQPSGNVPHMHGMHRAYRGHVYSKRMVGGGPSAGTNFTVCCRPAVTFSCCPVTHMITSRCTACIHSDGCEDKAVRQGPTIIAGSHWTMRRRILRTFACRVVAQHAGCAKPWSSQPTSSDNSNSHRRRPTPSM